MPKTVWDWDSRLWAGCVRAMRRIAESTTVSSRGLKGSRETALDRLGYGPTWGEIAMAERILAKLEASGCEGELRLTKAQFDFLHDALDGNDRDQADFDMLLVAARQDAESRVKVGEREARATARLVALREGEQLRKMLR